MTDGPRYQIAQRIFHPFHGHILYVGPDTGDGFLRFYKPGLGVIVVDPATLNRCDHDDEEMDDG